MNDGQSIGFGEGLKIKQTLALGCPLVVEALRERLGLRKTLQDIEKTAGVQVPYERALLAMVANRLCDPESKLGVWDRWLAKVCLPSCQGLKLRHMYEAMDLVHAHAAQVEKTVFFQVADLFNLEVDLIFYDTTTASFHVDQGLRQIPAGLPHGQRGRYQARCTHQTWSLHRLRSHG